MTETRLLYDRKNAAHALSISVRALDYFLANGAFQTRKVGKKRLIPHSELVRFARSDHFAVKPESSTSKLATVREN